MQAGRRPVRRARIFFALQVPADISALALPWTLARPMSQVHADQIRTRLHALYPAEVAKWFELGLARDRHRRAASAPAPTPKGLLARGLRKLRG